MNDLTISWPFRRDDEKIALIMIQKRKIALEALKPMWILITALLDLKDKSG